MTKNFSFSGKYYTSAELESLRTGDRNLILRTCGARHTEKSINAMMHRLQDPAFTRAGISITLRKLCVKLGIIPPRKHEYCRGGKLMNSYRRDVVGFLASLPDADVYDEEEWLDTPELWAFVDFSRITDACCDNGSRIPDELRRRMGMWRDRWVPLRPFYSYFLKNGPDSVYAIPNRQAFSVTYLARWQKAFILDHTFIPESYVTLSEVAEKSPRETEEIRKLLGKMSAGRVSFLCGKRIAEVMPAGGKSDERSHD